LSTIAAEDRELFLATHPNFRGRVIAVVLAQGAATHYVTGAKGVKDLDVWTFFSLPLNYSRFPPTSVIGMSTSVRLCSVGSSTTSVTHGMSRNGGAGSDGTIGTRGDVST
jgi:hypothetical protein